MKNLLPNELALKYILDCEVLYKEKIVEIEIAREKNPKSSKQEFSKTLLRQESALIWVITISFIVLAFICVENFILLLN